MPMTRIPSVVNSCVALAKSRSRGLGRLRLRLDVLACVAFVCAAIIPTSSLVASTPLEYLPSTVDIPPTPTK